MMLNDGELMTICLLNSHPYPHLHPYPWCYPYPRFSNAAPIPQENIGRKDEKRR